MPGFSWSVSRLLTYLRCPYAYFLKYKERIEAPKPSYLVFGAAIHKAIEICHKGPGHQPFTPTQQRPLYFKSPESFGGFWLGFWEREVKRTEANSGISWSNSGQKNSLKGLGWKMLAGKPEEGVKGYYRCILNPPFPVEVLAVEFRFQVKLWGHPFGGIIDQVWKTPKGIAIVDITTGRSQEVKFLQMTAYDLCFRQILGQRSEEEPLFKSAPNQWFVWSLREEKLIPTKPQDPNGLRDQLQYAAAGVQDGHFHETQQDNVCRWCEYRAICGKTIGQPLPASSQGHLKTPFPPRAPKPKERQLYFKKGAAGGWFRGAQVKGKGEDKKE